MPSSPGELTALRFQKNGPLVIFVAVLFPCFGRGAWVGSSDREGGQGLGSAPPTAPAPGGDQGQASLGPAPEAEGPRLRGQGRGEAEPARDGGGKEVSAGRRQGLLRSEVLTRKSDRQRCPRARRRPHHGWGLAAGRVSSPFLIFPFSSLACVSSVENADTAEEVRAGLRPCGRRRAAQLLACTARDAAQTPLACCGRSRSIRLLLSPDRPSAAAAAPACPRCCSSSGGSAGRRDPPAGRPSHTAGARERSTREAGWQRGWRRTAKPGDTELSPALWRLGPPTLSRGQRGMGGPLFGGPSVLPAHIWTFPRVRGPLTKPSTLAALKEPLA